MSDDGPPPLKTLIREAREQARPPGGSRSQAWLAGQFVPERHAQQISRIENGTMVPDLALLAELYEHIHHDHPVRPPESEFDRWVASWLEASWAAAQRPTTHDKARPHVDHAVRTLASPGRTASQPAGAPPRATRLRALTDFSTCDDEFTVILGDRRELRASKDMSAADCLIYSGSITDAMYLPELGAGISRFRIKSDKVLVKMPQETLEDTPEIADRHLLVVGSPAANWAARLLNDGAIFPFQIAPEAASTTAALLDEGRMQDPEFAEEFWEYAQKEPRERGDEKEGEPPALTLVRRVLENDTANSIMNKFRTSGFLDPADQQHHGFFTHPANDFAVVTMARNPYSRSGEHRAIICAGVHGPGTAAALRALLENPAMFADRPLGAVLEVRLTLGLDWPRRFEQSKVRFQTKPYEVADVVTNLDAACRADPTQLQQPFKDWDPDALRTAYTLADTLRAELDGNGQP